jgi:hypothetical protein
MADRAGVPPSPDLPRLEARAARMQFAFVAAVANVPVVGPDCGETELSAAEADSVVFRVEAPAWLAARATLGVAACHLLLLTAGDADFLGLAVAVASDADAEAIEPMTQRKTSLAVVAQRRASIPGICQTIPEVLKEERAGVLTVERVSLVHPCPGDDQVRVVGEDVGDELPRQRVWSADLGGCPEQ